jgi:hypothetical protein
MRSDEQEGKKRAMVTFVNARVRSEEAGGREEEEEKEEMP